MNIDETIELCSKTPITENSEQYRGFYLTEVKLENLEDIKRAKIYVKHMGNEYEALSIRESFSSVIIKARKGFEYEDKKNGFVDNIHERTTWKEITKEEIEDIWIEETSVYDEIFKVII